MTEQPQELLGLMGMVLLLGLKHGLDPDHLAAIDSLARCNLAERPRLSRWSGVLFSLGHGAVVLLIAVIVGVGALSIDVPEWLEPMGAAISIAFLSVLGLINAEAALRPGSSGPVMPRGLRGAWFAPLMRGNDPLIIAATGALFALSFDTISQAVMFSVTARHSAGWAPALAAGGVFTLGMLIADGVNGICIARLLQRADRHAALAARALTGAIALLSLGIAASSAWRLANTTSALPELGIIPGAGLLGATPIIVLLAARRAHDKISTIARIPL